ncbi:tyrosine kinase family protein [Mycobacterium kansasii]|uniref:non-specific serine/threonine protein kinase n=1 Tax=Mycobacterium kansasii TaxID=1768 RepID=A0A1V3WUL3_MYCKA|nr:tyrosine kinase family protein [Mycobacterium kansasii]
MASALWHPNIVRVNDRGEFDGKLWISMDFVDGTDAASLLRNRFPAGMPADQVVTIIAAIASALDHAHQHHNVMHRDVSPRISCSPTRTAAISGFSWATSE